MADKQWRIVAIDPPHTPSLINEKRVLEPLGAEVVGISCKNEDEIIEAARGADCILVALARVTRRVLESLPQLVLIGKYGVGVDNIDLEAATDLGKVVVNVREYASEEVSTHALTLMLVCTRRIIRLNEAAKSGKWDYHLAEPGYRLAGRNLGLLGFGTIARKLARQAQALGMNILTHDPFVDVPTAAAAGARKVEFAELLRESDFLSVHAVLNKDTYHLLGEAELRQMKPTAYLVNTARGGLIDEQALARALQEGWIAGAGLDVLEKEPPAADNPLLGLDNVVVTPHAAFYAEESWRDLEANLAEHVAEFMHGRWPSWVVNTAVMNKVTPPQPATAS
ncbi:MAG: C-terminal binding protein [Chloroflexota bacterium]|nr:MAG: C-terminal binding protein [Chloroflexota bacterium]